MTAKDAFDATRNAEPGKRMSRHQTFCEPRGGVTCLGSSDQ